MVVREPAEVPLKPDAPSLARPDYRCMTDKTNIWKITLGLLGTTTACAVTLLAGAHPAQAASPERDEDPIVLETPRQQFEWTESISAGSSKLDLSGSLSALVPDGGQTAHGIPNIIKPKPKPRPGPGPIWLTPEPAVFDIGIDLAGSVDLGTQVGGYE
jgi:hypothetical protein